MHSKELKTAPGSKSMICAALLAAGLGVSNAANAQDYRLAYSKAENIEIFVEGATQENWCAETLTLRAVHGGEADREALARLLPKLGALFGQQCPQAAVANWREMDATGKQVGQGSSRAADGWQLAAATASEAPAAATARSAPAVQPEPPAAPEPPASDEAGAQAAPTPAPAPSSGAQEPSQASKIGRSVGEAVGESMQAAGKAADEAMAEAAEAAAKARQVASEAGQAAAKAAQEAVQVATETGAAMREGFQSRYPAGTSADAGNDDSTGVARAGAKPAAPAQDSAGGAEQAAVQSLRGLADFAVGGWQPPGEKQRAELAAFMTAKEDQNGCKIVSFFDLGDQASYLTLRSEGLACGADGYAQGKGRLSLERSDGVQVARSGELWFSNGLVFNKPVQALSPAAIVAAQEQRTLWFGLDSDAASQSHYLLRASLGQLRGGVGIWQVAPQVDVLTVQPETFRQADAIRGAVDRALLALQQAMPNASDARLLFADGVEGIWARDQDKRLYEISASRPYNYRSGKPQGEWRYNLQQASNHLFQREARLAQQQRLEEERKERERQNELRRQARVEQDNLRQYEELAKLVEQGSVDVLRRRMERDIAYRPFGHDGYSRLMAGGQDTLTRIVRVDGSKGDDATVDWPYPMRLAGQKALKKGWYWITGERRLDAQQLDEDDLPMSIVTPQPGQVQACEKAGCADLLDPLAIVRMRLGRPDWTPQAARALIDSAPKGLAW